MHDILVIALSSPLLIGIYKDGKLIESIRCDAKSSDALPKLFADILSRYEIANLLYANGPGSFMAIKVSYLFLKTLSIVKKYGFYATDAFAFNENAPIKAVGKLYFVKTSSTITKERFDTPPKSVFSLPKRIDLSDFSVQTLPNYVIGAV